MMQIEVIVKHLTALLPGLAAILTLIFKQVDKRALKKLTSKVQDNFQKTIDIIGQVQDKVNINSLQNINQHQQLKQKIIHTQQIMNQHTQTISNILQEKDIAYRIRQISKHAIDYCGNKQLAKVLQVLTQQFISFMKNVVQIGFQNTTKQQIYAKFNVARSNIERFSKHVIRDDIVDSWKSSINPMVQQYLQQIFQIYNDHVNNKNSRFIIKSQDFAQTLIRDIIMFVATRVKDQYIRPFQDQEHD